MTGFATSLNFTSANEDGATELAALASKPGDRVLCLTASGARPLDLLLGEAGSIIALDLNPAQNQLLALKIAAFRKLEDDELLGFLGVEACKRRLLLYQRVAEGMDQSGRDYWGLRLGIIKAGVWNAGRWEKVLKLGAALNRLARGRTIESLFDAPDLEAQQDIWARQFDDWLWRGAIRLLSGRWFWTGIVGEPGGAFLPDASSTEARLAGLFNRAAGRVKFSQSDFLTLIFKGKHSSAGALPLHLQPHNRAKVRAGLDRITIVNGGLDELPALDLGLFDGFSLSDFGSYCSQAAYDACWAGVIATAAPEARFCERVFMNPLVPSAKLASRLAIDEVTSAALTARDLAIIYDIRAGSIMAAATPD
jgi:S-adenosylmethionine-diacylglycerol 3-amino-3-carboxypropyl transferase